LRLFLLGLLISENEDEKQNEDEKKTEEPKATRNWGGTTLEYRTS